MVTGDKPSGDGEGSMRNLIMSSFLAAYLVSNRGFLIPIRRIRLYPILTPLYPPGTITCICRANSRGLNRDGPSNLAR